MPGKDNMHGIDLEEDIKRMLAERIRQEADEQMNKTIMGKIGKAPNEFILPESVEYDRIREIEQRKFKDAIMQDWEQLKRQNPDEQFRRQVTRDIEEIKDAIRKIGILFDEDAPDYQTSKKHKMLKDAYNKYKMIEALVLEGDE